MKVSVEVLASGRVRLRWYYQGRQCVLSTGTKNSPVAIASAKRLAGLIEADILSGNYDPTLLKYKPRTGKRGTVVSAVELWQHYTKAMQTDKALSASAMGRYRSIGNHLEATLGSLKAEAVNEAKAKDFAAYLSERRTGHTVKVYLYLLAACWDWAKGRYHVAAANPWRSPLARVKPSPRKRVKPFTQIELATILSALQHHPHYNHYYPLVLFLAATGTRPGEAMALRWEHVADDFKSVAIGSAANRQGEIKSTKNHKERRVWLPDVVSNQLRDAHKQSPRNTLVFPAVKGGLLDDKRLARMWKALLADCGIPFRRIYTLRHSAISRALAAGFTPVAIAEQTGHLARTLMDVYAHAIESKVLAFDVVSSSLLTDSKS
ncbi:MAG: Tyrosine recombinase XerD [Dehalococcoidia bacterium]|nr:Tyrosine recombinase XerD [Chloroflexota bacterium]